MANHTECKHFDPLMMKYLDNTLSVRESDILIRHIECCESCRADFEAYDAINTVLGEDELLTAPSGFVEAVMSRLEAVEAINVKKLQSADQAVFVIFGIISVLLGSGLLLAYNSAAILDYLESVSFLTAYVGVMRPFSNVVNEYLTSFFSVFESFYTAVSGFLTQYRFVVIAAAVLSTVAWYLFKRKTKETTK